MDHLTLERRQVWAYLYAIIAGLLAGSVWPGTGPFFEAMLWPTLMLLLYATFVQVPLLHLVLLVPCTDWFITFSQRDHGIFGWRRIIFVPLARPLE